MFLVPLTRNNLLELYDLTFLIRYSILFLIDSILSTISMMNFHSLRKKENESHERLVEAVNDEHNKAVFIVFYTLKNIFLR